MERQREFDAIIVGAGARGSLVARELSMAGLSVVVLDAGRRFDPPVDFANTEANAGKIQWTEPRVYTGKTPIVPKSGVGVGGGTLTWLGVMPRFHRDDFRTQATEGVGVDWPIGYDDLAPYYAKVERDFGVAGECGPFAPESYALPMVPHRFNWHGQVLARGAKALGAHPFAPPIAINSTEYGGRPACCYCGWCASGCPTGAKATASGTYLAQAEANGAMVISEAFDNRVVYDDVAGKVSGVVYVDSAGVERAVSARIVIIAAHALETPRLLLLSACQEFPDGLANRSGKVGKSFMSHPTWQVFGTFDEPVNAYKGMQMGHVMVQDYYKPSPSNNYARGYVLISYMMTPITYGNLSGDMYGMEYKQFLIDYPYTAAWWARAGGLPGGGGAGARGPGGK